MHNISYWNYGFKKSVLAIVSVSAFDLRRTRPRARSENRGFKSAHPQPISQALSNCARMKVRMLKSGDSPLTRIRLAYECVDVRRPRRTCAETVGRPPLSGGLCCSEGWLLGYDCFTVKRAARILVE